MSAKCTVCFKGCTKELQKVSCLTLATLAASSSALRVAMSDSMARSWARRRSVCTAMWRSRSWSRRRLSCEEGIRNGVKKKDNQMQNP